MDPSFSIDLKTITGIVALTIMIVHGLKGWLASVPLLEKLPVAAYVVLVSTLLTLLSRDVLHLIGGDRGELLTQAVIQALVASGAVEWWRAGAKPLDESTRAQETTMKRDGFYLVPILLAVGIGAGCAKAMPPLLTAEKSVRGTIVTVSTTVEPLVCSAEARAVLGAAPCLQLLDALDPATDVAIAYNRALRSGKVPNIVEMVAAVDKLAAAVRAVVPASAAKNSALTELQIARARAEGGK